MFITSGYELRVRWYKDLIIFYSWAPYEIE